MNKAIAPILALLIIGAFLLVVTLFAQSERQLTEARQMLADERQRTHEALVAAAQWEATAHTQESSAKQYMEAMRGTCLVSPNCGPVILTEAERLERKKAVSGWVFVEKHGANDRQRFTACQPGQDCHTPAIEKPRGQK